MELTGKLKVKMDEQKFDSGFFKREFVVTTQEQYPQDVKFELFKEKCEMIANVNDGDMIKVLFDIRGNEYNGKYYNNLVAWKVEGAVAGAGAPQGEMPPAPMAAAAPIDLSSEEEDDGPF